MLTAPACTQPRLHLKNVKGLEDGSMAVSVAFTGDLCSVPRTHMVAHNHL